MTAPLAPFRVHVAGVPGEDHVQRCVPCGHPLLDNRPWWEGRVAVMDGDTGGPSWWPAGSLIATDKVAGDDRSASITYVVEDGTALDDDEVPCSPTTPPA